MTASNDICSNRHGGNRESREANLIVDKQKDRVRIIELIGSAKPDGLTLDETCILMRRQPNQISGRFTELKKAGIIVPSGARRPTRSGASAAVLILADSP